ncbi:hypothetical protein AbraIFM66950_006576, partial [Aspergillus brasiliensis]
MPPEIFAVANEVGVQGRFVENALNPVGEVINLLRLNMSFGDSQWGVTRKPDDEGKKRGRDASQDDENERGKLFPDIVLVENSQHKIRALAEIKTHWAFKPATDQTWQNFLSAKLGQLARYMDDHFCRYGFFTTYEYTWFVKRVDDTHFAASEPISASTISTSSAASLRECLLATAIRVAREDRSYYPVRYGKHLTVRRSRMTRPSRSP